MAWRRTAIKARVPMSAEQGELQGVFSFGLPPASGTAPDPRPSSDSNPNPGHNTNDQ